MLKWLSGDGEEEVWSQSTVIAEVSFSILSSVTLELIIVFDSALE